MAGLAASPPSSTFAPKTVLGHCIHLKPREIQAIAVAQAANAGQLVLFHHEPTYDDATIAEIEASAQKLFPNVRAAYEGMELKI